MALVLITYAFFVDSTLFNISFGIKQTILVISSVISVISLQLFSRYNNQSESDSGKETKKENNNDEV